MSASSRGRLTRLLESAYGTQPSSAAMLQIRRTGGSFSNTATRNPSEEVRPDLQTTDSPMEDFSATGSIEDEWVYGAHDAEVSDALLSTYSAAISLSSLTLTAADSDNSITRSAGSFISDGVVVGMFVEIGGMIQGTIRARVVTVSSATKIILDSVNASVTDEAATASCTLKNSGQIRMGTTARSVWFEEYYADIAELWSWRGSVCTSWDWGFSHPGKVRTTFNYNSAYGAYLAATAGNGTVTAYTANKVQESINHFIKAKAFEGSSAMTVRLKELKFTLSCPKRVIGDAGTLGAVDMGLSTFVLSGQMQVYNSTAARTMAAKMRAGTLTSLEWQMLDAGGNREHHWLPGIYFQGQGGSPSMGPRDSDVYITLPFTSIQDSTITSHYQHSKIAA